MTTLEKLEAAMRDLKYIPDDDTDFKPSADLFDYGYLDSFGIVELISYIDRAYQIDLSSEDFYADLRTLESIAQRIDNYST